VVRPIFSYATLEEIEAEKCSETALSLAADDVFGNYWWHAFNTNVCFGGYVNVATHLFIKQEAANRLLGNGCSYVPNYGHSEVLIKMTDEMPLLLAPRDKFVTLNIIGRKFSVDFPTKKDWNVLIWLHRMDSFSLVMDLFARAELVPAYSLTS
jgi:hypothetical protein